MREYETIYLLKADLPAEQLTEIKEKFVNTLAQGEGKILTQGDWGKRKLAYDVEKNRYAHYIYLQYLSSGEVVSNLERLLKLEDRVLKFLTVKLADSVNIEERIAAQGDAPEAPEEVYQRQSDSGPHRRGDRGDRGGRDYRSRDGGGDRGGRDYRSRDGGESRGGRDGPRDARAPEKEDSSKPSVANEAAVSAAKSAEVSAVEKTATTEASSPTEKKETES